MAKKTSKRKKIYTRLKNKYRLVMMNDETLEEKVSFRLSPLNVFVFAGTLIIGLVTLTIFLIAFTPLREYIPGYADVDMKRRSINLALKGDSLQSVVSAHDKYIQNLSGIISGNIVDFDTASLSDVNARYDTVSNLSHSPEDVELRSEIESMDNYFVTFENKNRLSGIAGFNFFSPVKGKVSNEYNRQSKHFGIDIVGAPDEVIKSTLDGTVVMADFTSETGYVIAVMHSNNLLSVYKHNSALLKKAGDFVKAGDVIAFIGNSGELTSGPHLHFELWYNGSPVNPQDYITF
ncbi:MAG TPA: M23 family metallopeptidase [Bacteroidia bacterium]|nr:M23 family metallopeptidase [Bacteroidia bacterium]